MSFHYQTSLCLELRKGCAISYFKLSLWIPTHNIKSQTLDMSFRNFTFWLEHHFSSRTLDELRVRRLTRWLSHALTFSLTYFLTVMEYWVKVKELCRRVANSHTLTVSTDRWVRFCYLHWLQWTQKDTVSYLWTHGGASLKLQSTGC